MSKLVKWKVALTGGERASRDKGKYHSALKIPPGGKWPLDNTFISLQ